MQKLPRAIRELTETFEKLPGIGPKSAQRLSFYLLHFPEERLKEFADRLIALKRNTVICSTCHHVSEHDPCNICDDSSRNHKILCVVEQPLDVVAIERSGAFDGMYHVLHGAIAPLSNIGPEQLFLHDLIKRLDGVEELILATNPTMEGEATALYITEYLQQSTKVDTTALVISRIGHGLPVGADIEYADGVTLKRSLEGRQNVS